MAFVTPIQQPLATCPRNMPSTATATATPSTSLHLVSNGASFVLTRIVFLRAFAFVQGVAFMVALHQNKPLIGDDGITPCRRLLQQAQLRGQVKRERRLQWRKQEFANLTSWQRLGQKIGASLDSFPHFVKLREVWWDRTDAANRPVTTVLWWARDRHKLNPWLDGVAWTGLLCSSFVLLTGAANVPLVLAIWICQRSLMAVGGVWYGYGWEPQLGELGFHSLFLVPLWDPFVQTASIHPAVVWCVRWHLFRIMLGAGLIKIKSGDRKWKDLTVMDYFYETQPVPNPLTKYFHFAPKVWHRFEVLSNHFVELIAPWLLIIPGPTKLVRIGGLMQLIFQVFLILSGNLSFLNWLTMVPSIMCLDDSFLSSLFPTSVQNRAAQISTIPIPTSRHVASFGFLSLVLWLSVPVIRNLLARHQAMNRSFDRLRLINTYGAFGSVSEMREEFVISSARQWDGPWKEYEFKVKPGDVRRKPVFLSPYHYRLDWQMWIAAVMRNVDRSPWLYKLLIKLLKRDKAVLYELMRGDPWKDSLEGPKYIRVDRYRYRFHRRQRGEKDAPYWDRERIGQVYPPRGLATLESLEAELKR